MRNLRLLACRILLAVNCLTVLPAQAQEARQITLMLDWFANPNHAPIIIAQRLGLFDKAGLEVKIVEPANPADPPKLVAAGKADLAISYQPQLHLQIAEGLPLARVGTLIASPLNCLLVRADSNIYSPTDLSEKRIGYSVSGVEEALIKAMLADAGVPFESIKMVNVNWSLSPALMSNQVDAVIGAYRNFELTQMRIAGVEGRCLPIEEFGVPVYDELIFIANPQKMKPGEIADFVMAIEQATLKIVNHPEEMWREFISVKPELDDELNRTAWKDTLPRFALRPAAIDYLRYHNFADFLLRYGLIASLSPPNTYLVDISATEPQ